MANTWNESGTTWSTGRWGTTDPIVTGWGADPYNDSASTWGDVGDEIVSLTAPDAIASNLSVGSRWNDSAWGQQQSWGQFTLNVADVMGLTGQASTSSVGSITTKSDFTGVLSGQSITSSVGSISPADVMGLTGVSTTSSVGDIEISTNPIVDVTGLAITSALGNLSPADVMGLTGQQATTSVAAFGTATGFGIQAFEAVDTGSNSSYTSVATGSNTSYSNVA